MRAGISGFPTRHSVLSRGVDIVAVTPNSYSGGRTYTLAAWLALVGLIIPAAEVQIYLGGAKFTVGRLGVMLLMLPALFTLFNKGRRFQSSDVFACATAIWIVVAGANAAGPDSLTSSVAEAIEWCGGYLVARVFFFGPPALRTFLKVLKILAFASIAFGLADSLSGRLIIHDAFGALLQVAPIDAQYRGGAVRAASTFDHAILFGAFCSLVAIILLYAERSFMRRLLYVGLCFFGCVLSWSSSGLMSFFLGLVIYGYDCMMKRYSWRWRALCAAGLLIAVIFCASANSPLGWIVSNLTLDPSSGYFRFMIWEGATAKIAEAPFIGYGFQLFDQPILDVTVDSVWLVLALRFGLPVIALLILTSLTAMLPVRMASKDWPDESYISALRTGFSIALVMFMFIGLTVHYWNYLWIFWGICIGIRVSLNEFVGTVGERNVPHGLQLLGR